MKKILCMVCVLVLAVAMMSTAFAASYKDGVVTYDVKGSGIVEVWLNGSMINMVEAPETNVKTRIGDLADGTYTLKFSNGGTDDFNVGTVEKPTEVPATEAPATEAPATEAPATEAPATEAPATEAPATEAPATEAPATEAPATEAPATEAPATEAPATEAPVVPTEKPVDDSDADDVPKTGDASTMTMVIVSFAMVLAAAWLVMKRVVRNH